MIHGQSVADADDAELEGRSAGDAHTGLDGLDDVAQVRVAGNNLVPGVGDADDGTPDLLVRQAHGLEERAVGRLLDTLLHPVAAHWSISCPVM